MAGAVVMAALRPGWPLLAILAWGVFSFGAVYPWAYWPLFAAAGALGLNGLVGDRAWRDPRLVRVLIALAAVSVTISLQALALPSWLVVDLSPGTDRFYREFRLGYQPVDLNALSLDPAATQVVLAEVVALGLLLVGAARLMGRWPLDWFVGQLMSLAVAVALAGIVQKALLDADSGLIYGFWSPRQRGEAFGPFVNRNHFAGWMVMVLPLVGAYGWALAQASEARAREGPGGWLRWLSSVDGNRVLLVLSALLIMTVAIVLTGSRSGMVAGAVGLLVLVVFLWRAMAGVARVIVTSTVLLILLAALGWAGAGSVLSRFGRASDDVAGRLSAWSDTMRIAADFPWFGTGLGGYRRAMLLYQTHDREAFYAQAHNDYLQLIAEGGLLVTLPAALMAVFVVIGIVRRLQSRESSPASYWLRRGAVAGLVGMAAQSVVEFSLQMPGNAVMFVALAALALHRPRFHSSHAHRV
jgi:hypothetical protein